MQPIGLIADQNGACMQPSGLVADPNVACMQPIGLVAGQRAGAQWAMLASMGEMTVRPFVVALVVALLAPSAVAEVPDATPSPADASPTAADAAPLADTAPSATDAAPAPLPIRVTLTVEEPLRLARLGASRGDPGVVGLTGAVAVVLRNDGPAPVVLRDLEAHGLLFRAVADGRLHVLVHSCACVREATEPGAVILRLAPGESRRVVLSDFGCSGGMWAPPPPGLYDLEYRVLPGPAPAASGDPRTLTNACRAAFTAEATWEGAPRSASLRIELKPPRRQ